MAKMMILIFLAVAAMGCSSTTYRVLDGGPIVKVDKPAFGGIVETLTGQTLSPLEVILYRAWLDCTRNAPPEDAERKCGHIGYVLGRDVKLPQQIVIPPANNPPSGEASQNQIVVVCGEEKTPKKRVSRPVSRSQKSGPTCQEKLKALEDQLKNPDETPANPQTR